MTARQCRLRIRGTGGRVGGVAATARPTSTSLFDNRTVGANEVRPRGHDDLACDMATAKCVRAGHLGEPCDATFFCVDSVCHDGGTASSHCDALGTNGSLCTFGIDCASSGCLNNVCASCT